ncbi:hypothetical protein [Sphingosinicella sp. CPCC 101087]|uniref:hypothetical protein n=1 Tax=Sphingosinicella sp. CPCC 101087 TaxID=2497754 RepID=UPI00101CBB33|nr:hypothetical protein [Sphingosinicella sp. CPCC 101087]
MQPNLFLRRVLMLDAASCLGMGALLVVGAGALAPLFGLDRSLLFGAGVALLPVGLFILWTGVRHTLMPWAVYLIVAGNLLWVLESLLVVRGAATTITALGTAFVLMQAAAVAGLSALEWFGIRRLRAAATRA